MTQTPSSKTAATGFKFLIWTGIGAAVVAIVDAIPGIQIPTPWDAILIPVIGALGKMIATYAATRAAENAR